MQVGPQKMCNYSLNWANQHLKPFIKTDWKYVFFFFNNTPKASPHSSPWDQSHHIPAPFNAVPFSALRRHRVYCKQCKQALPFLIMSAATLYYCNATARTSALRVALLLHIRTIHSFNKTQASGDGFQTHLSSWNISYWFVLQEESGFQQVRPGFQSEPPHTGDTCTVLTLILMLSTLNKCNVLHLMTRWK